MDKPTMGMNIRRGGAKLRSMGKAHGTLHMLLWQARQTELALTSAATTQKSLFTDVANWASSENRALSDVCSSASELINVYTSAQIQLSLAFRSFRKDMSVVLEGEKRCDAAQKKLQDAENKRLKLRKQVLRVQNRAQVEGENIRQSGDFSALQTQLAEAERTAERIHLESCEASREQEAVKLVVMKSALSKLSNAHLSLADQTKNIFEANCQIANELPEPPAPGNQLSCIRYTGFETTRAVVDRIKTQVQIQRSPSSQGSVPNFTSTPITSPNSSNWASPEPSAPVDSISLSDPPPPYNTSYFSGASPIQRMVTTASSTGSLNHHIRRRSHNNSTISPLPSINQRHSINDNGYTNGYDTPTTTAQQQERY